MTKLQIFTEKGNKGSSLDFPKELSVEANVNLLSQAFYVYQDRSHKGTSRVKTRSEVNATGAKVYRQKGTGGARHGDKKAPIFAGGGIAHGPKGVKRTLKLSDNQKRRALVMALTNMVKEGRIVIVEKIAELKKTKEANELLNKIASELKLKRPSKILLSLSDESSSVLRNFKNIKDVRIVSWNNLNAFEVINSRILITEKEALQKNKSSKSIKSTKGIKSNENTKTKLNAEIEKPKKAKTTKTGAKTAKKTAKAKTAAKTAKKGRKK